MLQDAVKGEQQLLWKFMTGQFKHMYRGNSFRDEDGFEGELGACKWGSRQKVDLRCIWSVSWSRVRPLFVGELLRNCEYLTVFPHQREEICIDMNLGSRESIDDFVDHLNKQRGKCLRLGLCSRTLYSRQWPG